MSEETVRFNLVAEPWIPCETLEGQRVNLGLRAVFQQAHTLRAIADPSPLNGVALHRLLLVILERALAPKSRAEWVALWKSPAFPGERVAHYLETWAHRLDLFDETRPFLQVAALEARMEVQTGKRPERMSVSNIALETSMHSSPAYLFEPRRDGEHVTAAQAARALLSYLSYAQGGRIQNDAEAWRGGTLRGGAAVLAQGNTLRETLLLNLLVRAERTVDDVPPWERPRDIERLVRRIVGPCDQMIFPVRRVCLIPERIDNAWYVREVVSAAGERCDEQIADPQLAYFVRDPAKPPVALRIDPERSAWRDATALFDAMTGATQFSRPHALGQIAGLVAAGVLPKEARFRLSVSGVATDQAKLLVWRSEIIPAPVRMLTDADCVDQLKHALLLAEAVAHDLEYRVLFVLCERALAPTERDADKGDIRKLRDSLAAMPLYWAELGTQFPAWLVALADDPSETAASTWSSHIKKAAVEAFRQATRRLGTNARSLAASAQAERTMYQILTEHLGPSKSTKKESAVP